MFGAELVDNCRSRRRFIADDDASGLPRKLPDDVRRKALRKHGKRAIEHDAHHFPVSGDGILPWRRFRHPSDGGARRTQRRPAEIHEAVQPERAQRWHAKRNLTHDVAQRVTAAIAIHVSIRQFADTDAVEDDDDRSVERGQGTLSSRNRNTEAIVVGDSPGPSNQVRLGSLRNQINCRFA